MKKTSSSQTKVSLTTSKDAGSENAQQVVIHYPRDGKPAEWVIIELQGKIEADSESFNGLQLGEFHVDEKGLPIFEIGNHKLEGKYVELPKPLLITEKSESSHDLNIVAVVKSKYIFKNRPKLKV